MSTLEGKLVANNMKVGIVVARFNEFITNKLLGGAMDGLLRHDVKEEDITVAWVPGAFEIPLIAKKMAMSKKYDAVICLGAVIRGSTSTTTMSAMKYPREWQQFHWRVKFRLCLAWSRRKISSRRLSAREVKPGIRDMIVHWVLWRW